MYSPEEIKVALRKYIASTGDTSIDEQSIINILDQGADRDFNMVAPTIKSIRENYGVKKSIPMWLRMLTFRLIYDCMASDADCNSEMTWYRLLGYENKVRELFCNIGINKNIQNMLLRAKGDKIKIDTILLDMVLGNESSQIIKELQKNNIKDSTKEKLNDIGITQDVQDMLWEVQAQKGNTKEKQIKEILIKSALGRDYEQVYNLLLSQAKSQEKLLQALGFNKKVFDSTSSWQMYSPEMKLRQSRFNPVNFPFSYAEVESNPIYVAMLHHLISEARVSTNTFIDVFGKMGYIPAFCAEGYTNKLLYSVIPDGDYDVNVFYKYYHGITDRPTKTYKVLQRYMGQIQRVLNDNCSEDDRDSKIRKIVSDEVLFIAMSSSDLHEYAAIKFCDMCFRKPYWEVRNVNSETRQIHIINDSSSNEKDKEIVSKNKPKKDKVIISKNRYIIDDYSSIKRAKIFVNISKEKFVSYAKALKGIEYKGKSKRVMSEMYDGWFEIAERTSALLYLDIPKVNELVRYDYPDDEYKRLAQRLLKYNGEWIITWKNYFRENDDDIDIIPTRIATDFIEQLKRIDSPIYEFKFNTPDRNVRNGISFITNINFDNIDKKSFESKYNIKLTKGEVFKKIEVYK